MIVCTCCPRSLVTMSASKIANKKFLSSLNFLIVQVSCSWNSYTSVPNHKCMISVVAHLWLEVEVRIIIHVNIIVWRKQIAYCLLYTFAGSIIIIRMNIRVWITTMLLNITNHIFILRHRFSPCLSRTDMLNIRTQNI